MKVTNSKILLICAIASMLLISSTLLNTTVHALSQSEVRELVLDFLKKVAHFRNYLTLDSINIVENPWHSPDAAFLIHAYFQSNETSYRVFMTLTEDGKVTYYSLEPRSSKSSIQLSYQELLALAKDTIYEYSLLTSLNSHDELSNLISVAAERNLHEIELGNFSLNISVRENASSDDLNYMGFIFHRIYNLSGVKVSYDYLSFYLSKDGLLSSLVDHSMYHLAVSSIISEEEAIKIARPYAADYARKHGVIIVKATAKLCLLDRDIREVFNRSTSDPFAVYLIWKIEFEFNRPIKGTPYDIYGYEVWM